MARKIGMTVRSLKYWFSGLPVGAVPLSHGKTKRCFHGDFHNIEE